MENIKKYLKSLGYTLLIIVGFTIILSILSYYNLLSDNVIEILKLVTSIISTIVGGFIIGKSSDRKGYKSGIKYGLVLTITCLLLAFIFRVLSWGFIIFAIILITSSMIGAMIGINKRVTN